MKGDFPERLIHFPKIFIRCSRIVQRLSKSIRPRAEICRKLRRVGAKLIFVFLFLFCLQLSPGENVMLDIQGYDELNHTIFTIATLTETSESDVSKKLHLDNTMRLLSPVDRLAFPFSYRLANETMYEELTNHTVHRIQLEDIYSTLKNRYRFNVTAIPCRPGYKFKDTICSCDKTIEGVLR